MQVTASEFDFVLSRVKLRQSRLIVQLVNFGDDPHDLALRRIAAGARTYRTPRSHPAMTAASRFGSTPAATTSGARSPTIARAGCAAP
jgi:hypothetical protein